MTPMHYLELQKAFAHTNSIRRGAGYEDIAAFLIASARLLQHYADYGHAQACLECAHDMYVEAHNDN